MLFILHALLIFSQWMRISRANLKKYIVSHFKKLFVVITFSLFFRKLLSLAHLRPILIKLDIFHKTAESRIIKNNRLLRTKILIIFYHYSCLETCYIEEKQLYVSICFQIFWYTLNYIRKYLFLIKAENT